ncbi:MAG: hypothetical protein AAGK38_02455 [Pseudomonadota bacterium]
MTMICLLALVFAGGGLSRLAKVEAAVKAEAMSSVTVAAAVKVDAEAAEEHCCDKQNLAETSCSGPPGLLVSSGATLSPHKTYRPRPATSRLCVDLTNSGMKRPPRFPV